MPNITSTAERIGQIYPFDPGILERVGEVADRSADLSYPDFLDANNIPKVTRFKPKNGKKIQVIDFIPPDGYDNVVVYHEAMATPLTPNAIMHVAAIALAAPDTRVIGVGNPGKPGQGYGKVKLSELPELWDGKLRPVVDPILQYLNVQKVKEAAHTGYSYGVDRVAATAQHATAYDHKVTKGIFMDPASVVDRGMWKLGKAYYSTEEHLDHYVQSTGSRPYLESRKIGGGLVGYGLGLLRPTNLAVTHVLGQNGFGARLDSALVLQPEMDAHAIWGTESELAINGVMTELSSRMQQKYGSARYKSTALPGQKHAMCDDIFLHAAMTLHGLGQQ